MKYLSIFSRANKASIAGLLFLLFTTYVPSAFADEHSPHSFSANVTLTSDYVYRGISQTNEDPALQGGFDYSHESGFYLGVWASSLEFNGGTSDAPSLEIDVYGGMSGEFQNGLGWDVGALYYIYPDQNEDAGNDYDFLEVYGALSYTWDTEYQPSADIGIAYSPDFYGENDTGIWVHGGLGFSIPDMVDPYVQVGYQDVDGDKLNDGFDYTYYAIGVSKSIDILTFDLSWQDASDEACEANGLHDDFCEAVVFSVSSSW